MRHHEPGLVLEDHLMSTARLLAVEGDAILLPTTITSEEALALLHKRAMARAAHPAPSKLFRFFCRLAMVIDGQQILLDTGSWSAARAFLRYQEDVEPRFMFSIVPRAHTGQGLLQGLRRRLGGDNSETICLVEPSFALRES